jgi:glutamyl-tRNA reductase
MIERAIKARHHRPICIVDLAVPRDVEAEVARLDDVYVYSMDELGAVVQSGRESRQAAVIEAESIINQNVREFERWLAMRAAVPAITRMRARAHHLCDQQLTLARNMLAAGSSPDEALDFLAHSLTHKLIHDPTILLRNAEGLTQDEREHMTSIVGRFFQSRPF